MLDAGPAQPNQVDAPRAVSLEDLARGGDTRSAPSAECAASSVTAAPGLQQLRSYDPRLLVSDRAAYSGRPHDRRAGNRYPVASGRLFAPSGAGNRVGVPVGQASRRKSGG